MENRETNQALAEPAQEQSAEARIEEARLQRSLEDCGLEYSKMKKELRSWGYWMMAIGVISLILSGLVDSSWGIMLMIVGGCSFYFSESVMFAVYGSMLAWAALSNLMGGVFWMGFAIIQAVIAYKLFRDFGKSRKIEKAYRYHHKVGRISAPPAPERAARLFPWLSALLSAVSLATIVGIAGGLAVSVGAEGSPEEYSGLEWATLFAVNLGVIGLAFGLASLLSRFRQKGPAVAGVVIGGIVLLLAVGTMAAGA